MKKENHEPYSWLRTTHGGRCRPDYGSSGIDHSAGGGIGRAEEALSAGTPSLTVNRGVVKFGVTVRAKGNQWAPRERVYVLVTFKPKNSQKRYVKRKGIVTADRRGRFAFNLKSSRPGRIIINARGTRSEGSSSAYVFVIDKRARGTP